MSCLFSKSIIYITYNELSVMLRAHFRKNRMGDLSQSQVHPTVLVKTFSCVFHSSLFRKFLKTIVKLPQQCSSLNTDIQCDKIGIFHELFQCVILKLPKLDKTANLANHKYILTKEPDYYLTSIGFCLFGHFLCGAHPFK